MRLKRREQALAGAVDLGQRLGRRHAHRRCARGVSRCAAFRRLRARRADAYPLRRPRARRSTALADAVARLSRRSWRLTWLTPLAVGRDFRPGTAALKAIHPFVDDLVDGGSTPANCNPVCRRAQASSVTVIDAHHHIWRQADLPWLLGPMQPRIFGPYEPIRRDYPIEEFLARPRGVGVESRSTCRPIGRRSASRTRRPGCSEPPTKPAGRTRSWLCRS